MQNAASELDYKYRHGREAEKMEIMDELKKAGSKENDEESQESKTTTPGNSIN